MDLNTAIDDLLEQQCYIVDILPIEVPKDSAGQYLEIEAFYLLHESEYFYKKFADLLLKLNCYFDFHISWDDTQKWEENPNPQLFYDKIVACDKEKTYMNIIIKEENTMLIVNGDSLYILIYNPSQKVRTLLSVLCTTNNFFFRKAKDENIHDHIVNEFLELKSASSFIWLINKGREIEFLYRGNHYFVSKSNSCSYVSLWYKDYEQGFTSVEMLWEDAEIAELKIQQIWHEITIETVF